MSKQWIYKTEKVGSNDPTLRSELNKLSEDGWELVQLINKKNGKWTAVLKTEKKDIPDRMKEITRKMKK